MSNPWRDLVSITDVDALASALEDPEYWPVTSACSGLVKQEVQQALRRGVISPTECVVLVARLYDVRALDIALMLDVNTSSVNRYYNRALHKLKQWRHCGVATVLVETFGRAALDVMDE